MPGAGAFEIAVNKKLLAYKDTVKGKTRLGIQAFAEALLIIPKALGKFHLLLFLLSAFRRVFNLTSEFLYF